LSRKKTRDTKWKEEKYEKGTFYALIGGRAPLPCHVPGG
jgi:hypothetical protein